MGERTELKACPFCGSRNLEARPSAGRRGYIDCRSCGATGPEIEGTRWDAARAWNRRAELQRRSDSAEKCAHCEGAGTLPRMLAYYTCQHCNGTGQSSRSDSAEGEGAEIVRALRIEIDQRDGDYATVAPHLLERAIAFIERGGNYRNIVTNDTSAPPPLTDSQRDAGSWVPWKPGDALPEDGVNWATVGYKAGLIVRKGNYHHAAEETAFRVLTDSPTEPSTDSQREADARRIMERAASWLDIQGVAHTGELSAKARSIRDDMRRWLANGGDPQP